MARTDDSSTFVLPTLPVAHQNFVSYINNKDGNEVQKLVAPFNQYEAKLREASPSTVIIQAYRIPTSMQSPFFIKAMMFLVSPREKLTRKLIIKTISFPLMLRIESPLELLLQ